MCIIINRKDLLLFIVINKKTVNLFIIINIMVDKKTIRQVIDDLQIEVEQAEVMPRNIELEENGNYVFVGLRRAGKSYIMFHIIKQLLQKGMTWANIVYINFEDERLSEMCTNDLNSILEVHYEKHPEKPFLFLDEIHNIAHWDKFVRRLADSKYRVYVTGSNSKMLSSDVATTLGGRFIVETVYPYSFEEWLKAKGEESMIERTESTIGHSGMLRLFDEYFHFGGLPELLLFKQKRRWLSDLYQKLFFGDLIARNGIRNDKAVNMMLKKMAESVKQPMSYTRIANIVSTIGHKISTKSVIDYIAYAEASWIIVPVRNYAAKLVEKESNRKYYFIDNGLLNLFLMDEEASLLENLVALCLFRRYGKERVFFCKDGVELDFYVPDVALGIQISFSLKDKDTIQREIEPFVKFEERLSLRQKLIITYDDTATPIECKSLAIDVVPAWRWLLQVFSS